MTNEGTARARDIASAPTRPHRRRTEPRAPKTTRGGPGDPLAHFIAAITWGDDSDTALVAAWARGEWTPPPPATHQPPDTDNPEPRLFGASTHDHETARRLRRHLPALQMILAAHPTWAADEEHAA